MNTVTVVLEIYNFQIYSVEFISSTLQKWMLVGENGQSKF